MPRRGLFPAALIAVFVATLLIPRVSYACTVEEPQEFFESHLFAIPQLPDGVSVYTTFKEIARAVGDDSFSSFMYEDAYDLKNDRIKTSHSFIAITNRSDKPLYVLADHDNEWLTPAAPIAVIVPSGFIPMFEIATGEGLALGEEALVDFEGWHRQIPQQDIVDDASFRLYHNRNIIDIVVTFTFTYNVNYPTELAASDRAMEECQRMMDAPVEPDRASVSLNQIVGVVWVGTIILVTVSGAVWWWRSRQDSA